MNLGIFARTFARPTVDEVFAAVARHHLHCVHFNFACAGMPSLPAEIDPAVLDEVRKSAGHHRLVIAGVSATFNMIHPDRKKRREGLQRLGVVAGACARLETGLITVCTGTRDSADMWRHHPENNSPAAWRDLLVSLTKALTTADKHNVVIGIEPETGNVVSSARHARRLLDEMRSPRLKIVIDPANLFRPGDLRRSDEIFDEAFDLLGGDLVMAHAKELAGAGSPGGLPLGAGVLDWTRYLQWLRRAGFSGPLMLHGFDEAAVAQSLEFIRQRCFEPTNP